MDFVDVSLFHHLNSSPVEDHIFDLYTDRHAPENENLGYINRSTNELTIELANGQELNILQSMSELNSTKETSSTGFICWKSSVLFLNWLDSEKCPFKLKNMNIVELGSGVGGILASALGPKSKSYVASDQKHILKLLKRNIVENTLGFMSSTIDVKTTKKKVLPVINVIEFDWEYIKHGMYEYEQINQPADLIVSCDTIYNEFLVPHLVEAIKSLLTPTSGAIITAQLRDPQMCEVFVQLLIEQGMNIYSVPNHLLSPQLLQGFVVYYLTL